MIPRALAASLLTTLVIAAPSVFAQTQIGACDSDGDGTPDGVYVFDPTTGTTQCVTPDGVDPTTDLTSPPSITVAATPAALNESEGQGSFTFTRTDAETNPMPSDVTVRFTVTGTATNGTDFKASGATWPTAGTWTIVIPGDPGTAQLFITPVRDLVADDDETIIVTIEAATDGSYTRGDPATATMNLDDAAPNLVTIEASDDVATEGSTTDLGRILVKRTGATTGPLKVKLQGPQGAPAGSYNVTPTSANATDGGSFITIPAGASQFEVQVRALNVTGGGQTLTLGIAPITTAEPGFPIPYNVGASSSASVTLIDADLPVVKVEVTDGTFNETNSAAIRFTRAGGDPTQPFTVEFEVSGTATRGVDYETAPAGVTSRSFAAGEAAHTLVFAPIQDTAREGTETVNVTIQPSTAYQILAANGAVSLNLIDDDVPTVTVTPKVAQTTEGSATGAAWTFTRSNHGLVNDLTVNFRLTGTAVAADYIVATPPGVTFQQGNGTLSFAANVRSINVTVTAIDDALPEGSETLVAQVVPQTTNIQYGVGSPGSATVTILDNDILDNDNDGIDDATDNCLGVANASQADADADGQGNACDADDDNDGLTDAEEAALGTDPVITDSDGDGRGDGAEVAAGTDPTDVFSPEYRASSVTAEIVPGGIQVAWRGQAGALVDRFLVFRASDPTLLKQVNATGGQTAFLFLDEAFPGGNHTYYVQAMLSSQGGSAFDAAAAVASPPIEATVCEVYPTDSDGDGLCDHDEVLRGTDPQLADSDGDGIADKDEVDAGSDPADPLSPRTTAAGKPILSKEGPFWLGLVLAVGALALLIVGLVMMRKREPAA